MNRIYTFDDRYGCHHEVWLGDRLFHKYGTCAWESAQNMLNMQLFRQIHVMVMLELRADLLDE